MDWFPTLASLAGIKIPDRIVMDGRDLSNLLKGRTDEVSFVPQAYALNAAIPLRRYWNPAHEWSRIIDRNEYLNAFFYHGSHGALAAVRSGKWKLHLHPDLTLYNLETDPGERNPVDSREVKRKLRGMVVLFQEEMRLYSRPAGRVP
jgi:arylsulfatase A-like enzyme